MFKGMRMLNLKEIKQQILSSIVVKYIRLSRG